MTKRSTFLKTLRGHDVHVALAVFIMSLQVTFTAAHLSAMSVAAAIGGPTGERLGFLQICTAEGLRTAPLDPSTPHSHGEGSEISCAICGSAAVNGFEGVPTTSPVPAPTPHILLAATWPASPLSLPSSGFHRAGTTRGPPLVG